MPLRERSRIGGDHRNGHETLRPYGAPVPLPALALEGLTIGITADRRAEEQARMLVQRGAKVLHGPVLRTAPVEDEDRIREATTEVLDRPADIVIVTTALGVRTWLSLADGWGLTEP